MIRPKHELLIGDVMDVLPELEAESFDAMLCDPPYGLSGDGGKTGFMGKEWDGRVPGPDVWRETLRVLKPGAYALVFGGTRTFHRLAVALEDAGFEVRDTLMWVYGCLSEDTEILVDGKWEPYHRATKGRHALCYDTASGTLSWQPISELLVYDYEDTAYHIHSDSTDQVISRNHRVIVERGGVERFEFAENLAQEHEIRVPVLESLRGVPRYLPLHDEGAGSAQRGVREGVSLQATQPQKGGHREAAPRAQRHGESPLRGMRSDGVAPASVAQEREPADLLTKLQRPTARQGVGEARPQGPRRLDGGQRAQLPREDERREQPRLEGRRHLLSQAWELCAHQVRALSARVRQHGPQRWVRHGAPLGRSAMPQPALVTFGSGASHQSRPDRQPHREPDAVRLQPRAQAVRASRLTRTTLARIEPIHYTGKVWCVRVPTGAFVARRNGHIFVTGNSGFPKSKNLGGDWQGYGTALKPAYEPILLVRKPTPLTYAQNALEHGTGALNIDASRVGTMEDTRRPSAGGNNGLLGTSTFKIRERKVEDQPLRSGRWPANLIHDGSDEVVSLFPQAGKGSASRFFYCAKAGVREREAGLDDLPEQLFARGESECQGEDASTGLNRVKKRRNPHPTVKPLALTEYLARLLLPPERDTPRRLLVPFAGSGSEMIGAGRAGWDEVIGIEREAEYVAIAEQRLAHWLEAA